METRLRVFVISAIFALTAQRLHRSIPATGFSPIFEWCQIRDSGNAICRILLCRFLRLTASPPAPAMRQAL